MCLGGGGGGGGGTHIVYVCYSLANSRFTYSTTSAVSIGSGSENGNENVRVCVYLFVFIFGWKLQNYAVLSSALTPSPAEHESFRLSFRKRRTSFYPLNSEQICNAQAIAESFTKRPLIFNITSFTPLTQSAAQAATHAAHSPTGIFLN